MPGASGMRCAHARSRTLAVVGRGRNRRSRSGCRCATAAAKRHLSHLLQFLPLLGGEYMAHCEQVRNRLFSLGKLGRADLAEFLIDGGAVGILRCKQLA